VYMISSSAADLRPSLHRMRHLSATMLQSIDIGNRPGLRLLGDLETASTLKIQTAYPFLQLSGFVEKYVLR
jgi:hypothetical protein